MDLDHIPNHNLLFHNPLMTDDIIHEQGNIMFMADNDDISG